MSDPRLARLRAAVQKMTGRWRDGEVVVSRDAVLNLIADAEAGEPEPRVAGPHPVPRCPECGAKGTHEMDCPRRRLAAPPSLGEPEPHQCKPNLGGVCECGFVLWGPDGRQKMIQGSLYNAIEDRGNSWLHAGQVAEAVLTEMDERDDAVLARVAVLIHRRSGSCTQFTEWDAEVFRSLLWAAERAYEILAKDYPLGAATTDLYVALCHARQLQENLSAEQSS